MPDTKQPLIKGSEAHLAKQRAMANPLLGAIPPDMPHNVLLEALLTVYIGVAQEHPCCTLSASHALALAHVHLQAAALLRPASAHVH